MMSLMNPMVDLGAEGKLCANPGDAPGKEYNFEKPASISRVAGITTTCLTEGVFIDDSSSWVSGSLLSSLDPSDHARIASCCVCFDSGLYAPYRAAVLQCL
jgi:hypothetical protein